MEKEAGQISVQNDGNKECREEEISAFDLGWLSALIFNLRFTAAEVFCLQHEMVLNLNLRKFLMLSILLVCIFFSPACQKQSATSFKTTNNTKENKDFPKNWKRFETEDFSFSIPLTMKRMDVRGIDSEIIRFGNKEIILDIEFGEYSADVISQLQNYEGEKEQAVINGEKAIIVSYDAGKPLSSQNRATNFANKATNSAKYETVERDYFIGIDFPNSMKSYDQSAVSFVAKCKTLEARETAKTILYSIKLKQK